MKKIPADEVFIGPCDAEQIVQFVGEAKKADLVFNKSTAYYCARAKGKMIAICGVMIYASKAVFKNDYVLPEYRRNGVWKMLYDYRLALVTNMESIKKIEATCTDMSLPLYLRMGARVTKKYARFTKVEIVL